MIDEAYRLHYFLEDELVWRLRGGPLSSWDLAKLANEVAWEVIRRLDRENIQIVQVHGQRARPEED
jgi:hypothetical protein